MPVAAAAAAEQLLLGGVALLVCTRLHAAGLAAEAASLAGLAALAAALALLPSVLPPASATSRVAAKWLRPHADSGLLFGCCALPCLWAAMACRAADGSPGRGALLLQLRLSLGAALALLLSQSALAGRSAAALLAFTPLLASGAGLVLPHLLHGTAFAGGCALLFEATLALLPRCFTVGEAIFAAQGIASVAHAALLSEQRSASVALELSGALCTSTLAAVALLALLWPWLRPDTKTASVEPARFFAALLGVIAAIHAPWLLTILERNRPTAIGTTPEWLGALVVADDFRCVRIAVYWLVVVGLIPMIPRVQAWLSLPQIGARKLFHALALLLFSPIVATGDIELLALAFAVATNLFVLCEALRICKLPPLGAILDDFMQPFLDPRDEGAAVLTHIYLLLGCAIPVWCDAVLRAAKTDTHPESSSLQLLPFCGLLSIGVLDSLAAVFGTRFGRTKWPGTRKSVEGTVCAVVGTLAIAEATNVYVCSARVPLHALAIPIVVVGLLEACTQQIDNVALPVVMVTLFLAQ